MAAGEPANLELAATAEIDATIVSMTADEARFDWTGGDRATADAPAVRTSDAGDSSDEPRTHLSEHTNDDAAIARASGEPIEPQHVEVTAATESHFVFDRTPVLNHGTGATGLERR